MTMVNLTHSELEEITPTAFPPASVDNLKDLRNQLCGGKGDFQLQSQQRFLRRVLSPDSPARNLLAIHGTGVGKTCTAIQIAEEYILRPEFQDKRVLVITSPAVQANFRSELFRMDRVILHKDGDSKVTSLTSQQCTGRRYLEMLQRIQPTLQNWENPVVREKLDRTADRIIDEFYEFMGYIEFGDKLNTLLSNEADVVRNKKQIEDTFNNRLIIIDEAHNIREIEKEGGGRKGVTQALERLSQVAEGMVFVLLTATPMYDSYEEIVFYMNLFLWNDRKQDAGTKLKPSVFFNDNATLKPAKDKEFRDWCQQYVSYVKGESPFTFPFRLPPPEVAPAPARGFDGGAIEEGNRLKYIPVVVSMAQGPQDETLKGLLAQPFKDRPKTIEPSLAVLPGDIVKKGDKYDYADPDKPFLKKEYLAGVSAKFAKIIELLENSTGVVMVYSNARKMGSDLFAMALEEHGYRSVITKSMTKDSSLLQNPTEAVAGKRYALLVPETPDRRDLMEKIRSEKNRDGSEVRVILTSPATSEGVDFRFVRQVHILDPWWNMSRMEQVAGRAMRTCSHQLLGFENQNCTIYYHVTRTSDNRECYDEYIYRTMVVEKAMKIARVRKVMAESAMDCPLQNQVNTLPPDWKALEVEQQRSEGNVVVKLPLAQMMAPTFNETPDVQACVVTPSDKDPDHERPLSSYTDVRDEILGKLTKLFVDKPIWDRTQLFGALKAYEKDVVVYTLQNAISTGYRFRDAFGRPSLLESHDELYALAPIGVANRTVVERTTRPGIKQPRDLPALPAEKAEPLAEIAVDVLETRQAAYAFHPLVRARFSSEILNQYVFDHDFTPEEKRLYLRNHADRVPLSARLDAGEGVRVLGNQVFEPADLSDAQRRAVDAWTKRLIARFIENKAIPFGTLKSTGEFMISNMVKEGESLRRKPSTKTIGAAVCGTGTLKPVAVELAKQIDSTSAGIPKEIEKTNAESWCQYTELLMREENGCAWVTPEEWSVLNDNPDTQKVVKAGLK